MIKWDINKPTCKRTCQRLTMYFLLLLALIPNLAFCIDKMSSLSIHDSTIYISSEVEIYDDLEEIKIGDFKEKDSSPNFTSSLQNVERNKVNIGRIIQKNPNTLLFSARTTGTDSIKTVTLSKSYSFYPNQQDNHFLVPYFQKLHLVKNRNQESDRMIYNNPYFKCFLLKASFSRPPPPLLLSQKKTSSLLYKYRLGVSQNAVSKHK